mgnify:CR=1 FL=1
MQLRKNVKQNCTGNNKCAVCSEDRDLKSDDQKTFFCIVHYI